MKSSFSYLFEWASAHKWGYISSILIALLSVTSGIIPYFAISKIVTLLFEGSKTLGDYNLYFIIIALGFFFQILFHNLSTSISHEMTFTVISEVRQRMCDKLLKVPMGNILSRNSGTMKDLIVERTDSIEPALAHLVPEMTSKLTVPIIIWLYIMSLDYRIGLYSLLTLPIGVIAYSLMTINYETNYTRYLNANKELNSTVVEYINGIEVIKAFNNSAKSYKRFVDVAYAAAHSAIDWMKSCQLYFSIAMIVIPATLCTVLPACVYYFLLDSLALSDFITIIILSVGMMTPIISAMSMVDDLERIGTIVSQIVSILEEEELERPSEDVAINSYSIKFKDVSFGYNDTSVLNNVNLVFNANEVTALVGPSGSGKSTIAKLIASMWETNSGNITIGGLDIKSIPLKQLNEMVAYVSQDNFLFDESIMENIRKGRLGASDEEVIEIAKLSGCHNFIMNLSSGYETIVGGSGGHLSGGERQRISIARAMMKDSPIIILDEATAYTDPENEAVIQEAVSKLVKNKTLIVVAHRLSTVKDSDKIVVIENGKVNAEGKHEELLLISPLYKDLYLAHMGAKDSEEVVKC